MLGGKDMIIHRFKSYGINLLRNIDIFRYTLVFTMEGDLS